MCRKIVSPKEALTEAISPKDFSTPVDFERSNSKEQPSLGDHLIPTDREWEKFQP